MVAPMTVVKGESPGVLFVKAPFNALYVRLLEAMPHPPGHRPFNMATGLWAVEDSKSVRKSLRTAGFDLKGIRARSGPVVSPRPSKRPSSGRIVTGPNLTLYPFQEEGVEWLLKRRGRALLADEMGLGKTVQVLAFLKAKPNIRPALVVCPASLKLNWAAEATRWGLGDHVRVLYGSPPRTEAAFSKAEREHGLFIINYDILGRWLDVFQHVRPKAVVFDECHYIKTPSTARTKAAIKLARRSLCVICLSGTPITSRPSEMYTAIRVVDPNLFTSRWEYLHRYCAPRHNGFGWDFTGASNTRELHKKLVETIMLRRLKRNVLKDLPPKRRAMVPVPLTNMHEYNRILLETDKALNPELGTTSAMAKIEALKQKAVEGKIDAVVEWATNLLTTGQKLVLFAVHVATIDTLMERLKEWAPVRVSGNVSMKRRNEAVQRFQTDRGCRLFIGNIQAAGVGLTLTAASNVAFAELPWTPGELTQAEDRIHRIGQEGESITSWLLLADHTIDMDIASLLDRKAAILSNVLDGQDTDPGTLLTELMAVVHRHAAALARPRRKGAKKPS